MRRISQRSGTPTKRSGWHTSLRAAIAVAVVVGAVMWAAPAQAANSILLVNPLDNSTYPAGDVRFVVGNGVDGIPVTVRATAQVGGGQTTCKMTLSGGDGVCTMDLAAGQYTAVASYDDGSGSSFGRTFTVTGGIVAPVIQAPRNLESIATAHPTFVGSFAGVLSTAATVTVTEGSTTYCSVPVAAAATTWTCDAGPALRNGPHTVIATASAPGSTSRDSAPRDFTVDVDTTPPPAPDINAPAQNALLNTRVVPISGTAEAGSTVTVNEGAVALCSNLSATNGSWSCAPSLADGQHTVTATATDAAGNNSSPSAARSFTVDATAPGAPTFASPANGSFVRDTQIRVNGGAETGSTVTVKEGATTLCTVASAASAWDCSTKAFAQGIHTLTATASDAAGNVSAAATTTFTVDSIAPALPVIKVPADGSSTNDTTPTVSGTAERDTSVTVLDEHGNTVCSAAPVGTTGAWSCTSAVTFAAGTHQLTASATDRAGNQSSQTKPTTFTVDLTPPVAPTITTPTDNAILTTGTPTIGGAAETGDTIHVTRAGGAKVCDAQAVDGQWSCTAVPKLADGRYEVTATAEDPAGNTTAGDSVSFTIDTVPPTAPVISTPRDGGTTNSMTPRIAGTAEAGSTATVENGTGVTACADVPVSAEGQWSCTAAALAEGAQTITPTAKDRAGHETVGSPVTFTIDRDAIASPTIEEPVDGSATNTGAVTVSGNGPPGTTITVADDSSPVIAPASTTRGLAVVRPSAVADICGPVTVNEAGTWTCGSLTFAEGTHVLVATAEDVDGNQAASAPVEFVVDLTAPDAPTGIACMQNAGGTATCSGSAGPGGGTAIVRDAEAHLVCQAPIGADGSWSCTSGGAVAALPLTVRYVDRAGNESASAELPHPAQITAPVDGTATNDSTPTLSGTVDGADATISVQDADGAVVCVAEVTDGAWSCTPTIPLPDGALTLRAVAADANGNTFAGFAIGLVIDTAPPAAPTGCCTENSNGTVTCTGRAEADSTVAVTTPAGGPVCTVVASAAGAWKCTSTGRVAATSLRATAKDAAGNVSGPGILAVTAPGDGGTGPGDGGTGPGDGGGTGPGNGGGSGGSGGTGGSGSGNGTGLAAGLRGNTARNGVGGNADGSLAFTGSTDTGLLVLLGGVVLAVGAVARGIGRRRKPRRTSE